MPVLPVQRPAPERPAAPAPVRAAVKVMYAGAGVSAASLIASLAYLAYLVGAKDAIRKAHLSLIGMGSCSAGHCHAAEVSARPLPPAT